MQKILLSSHFRHARSSPPLQPWQHRKRPGSAWHRRWQVSFLTLYPVKPSAMPACPIYLQEKSKGERREQTSKFKLRFPLQFSWMNLLYTIEQDVWGSPAFLLNKGFIQHISSCLSFSLSPLPSQQSSKALRWQHRNFLRLAKETKAKELILQV